MLNEIYNTIENKVEVTGLLLAKICEKNSGL